MRSALLQIVIYLLFSTRQHEVVRVSGDFKAWSVSSAFLLVLTDFASLDKRKKNHSETLFPSLYIGRIILPNNTQIYLRTVIQNKQ